jgi:hypothetical protein
VEKVIFKAHLVKASVENAFPEDTVLILVVVIARSVMLGDFKVMKLLEHVKIVQLGIIVLLALPIVSCVMVVPQLTQRD